MNNEQQMILRPVEYQQIPNYQPVNPYQQFQQVQPQYIVVQQPIEQKPVKTEKAKTPKESSQFRPQFFWPGIALLSLVFLYTGHKAQLADTRAEAYKVGYQNGIESAQLQIQQAQAAQKSAEAATEGYKTSLSQIQSVIEQSQQPFLQVGVINK